ncbi:hypothetical protein N9W08_00715, partial [Porticoccaceae bacterium]|nr:hypothetical protein [Porticoccaceae bacterium]
PYKPEPVKDSSWLKVTVVLVPLAVLVGVYFGSTKMTQVEAPKLSPAMNDSILQVDESTNSSSGEPLQTIETKPLPIDPVQIKNEALAVPYLVIAGHMYLNQGSTSNRLFIGERSFREGDAIDSVWTLVAINSDSFMIRADDRVETIPFR